MQKAWTVAGALLAAVTMANIYRAATQAIVYDEAATYLIFVTGPIDHVFTWYNANNHVLFTLLANATTEAFGVSELTLRLPSVMAGTGYLVVAAILARRICTRDGLFLLTFCALALNPLVFDFQSAARGYGLALFLFMAGLMEVSHEPGRQRWVLASFALGGAICANLAFLFPALAVWVTASAIGMREHSPRAVLSTLALRFWLPGAFGAAAFLAVPLRDVTGAYFFFGARTLAETTASLLSLSVAHHPTWWTHTRTAMWLERGLMWAVISVVIATILVGLTGAIRLLRGAPLQSQEARWQVLLGGTWAMTIAVLVGAHVFAGVLYPKERTGLYLIPLVILSLAALCEWGRSTAVRWSMVAILVILTLTSIEQFTMSSYGQWRYDAGSRRIAEMIASWPNARGGTLKVAATQWLYQPALEFYRIVRFPERLGPVMDGYDPARAHEFDFLVVNDADAARMDASWQQVYVDRVSGAHLLIRRDALAH